MLETFAVIFKLKTYSTFSMQFPRRLFLQKGLFDSFGGSQSVDFICQIIDILTLSLNQGGDV